MIDYAIEQRQKFIQGEVAGYFVDPTEYESLTLESRRYRAQEYLKRRGKWIIEPGNLWSPGWGIPGKV